MSNCTDFTPGRDTPHDTCAVCGKGRREHPAKKQAWQCVPLPEIDSTEEPLPSDPATEDPGEN